MFLFNVAQVAFVRVIIHAKIGRGIVQEMES